MVDKVNVKPHPTQAGYKVIYFTENGIYHEICVEDIIESEADEIKHANDYLNGSVVKDESGESVTVKGYYDLYPDLKPIIKEG